MNQTQLYTLIGDLTNDPNHDRYTTSQIDTQLDIVQERWNVVAGIIVDSTKLTTVAGTAHYDLTTLDGTLISFLRVAHKGIELQKKSKAFLDLYSEDDWSSKLGTPIYYYIEMFESDNYHTLVTYPTPTDADAGFNLIVEYVKRHTPMATSSDEPFNANPFCRPYHFGVAYEVAANLLTRDPDQQNAIKIDRYQRLANNTLTDLRQVFRAFDKDEPMRLEGGRNWRY